MNQREELIRRIKDLLAIYAKRVDMDKGEASRPAETFYCGLLNILLGYQLKNMNLVRPNYPAIDLGDDSEGVRLGVQVTSTKTRQKVQDTLDTFFRNGLEQTYTHLVMLIVGDWTENKNSFRLNGTLNFDPKRDIWDTDRLVQMVEAVESLDHLERIMGYLERNLKLVQPREPLMHLPMGSAMRAEAFVGRQEELRRIGGELAREGVAVLSGLGGMGKTELALRYGQGYILGHVYFVHFSKSFERTVLDNIAPYIPDFSREGKSEEQIYQEAMAVLRRCDREDLLILDNADGAEESVDQLRRKLSALPMKVLVTTRAEDDGAIPVGRMDNGKLYEIFRSHKADISEDDMDALIAAVDGHTLTVDLMVRSMVKGTRRTSAKKLLEALKKRDLASGSFTRIGAAFPGASRQARINEHLRTVFRVASLSEGEQQLLRLATLLPESGLDPELFTSALEDPDAVADGLDELVDKGWLTMKKDLLAIHPVICIVCREELKPTDENCGDFLRGVRRQRDPKRYDDARYRQMAALFEEASQALEDRTGFWATVAGYLWNELADSRRALRCNERVVERLEQSQPDSVALATVYGNLGTTYGDLGDHKKALEYELKALTIREKVLPPEDPPLATTYNNLGCTYGDLGDHKKALEYKLKALAIQEKVLSQDHPDLANSCNNVGMTYGDLGDHKKALKYELKALTIREKVLSPDHPSLAISYNNVGTTYGALGDHEKALEYQMKALTIREKVLPPDHPDLAISCNDLGLTYGDLGDHKKALEYQLKALAIQEKVLPPEHRRLAISCNNVGVTYGDLGDHEKALEYKLKALAIFEKVLPPTHPDLALSFNNLARTYYEMGRLEQALDYMRRALEIAEHSLPEEHPSRVNYRAGLVLIERELQQSRSGQ